MALPDELLLEEELLDDELLLEEPEPLLLPEVPPPQLAKTNALLSISGRNRLPCLLHFVTGTPAC
jgi:hypothetical protein